MVELKLCGNHALSDLKAVAMSQAKYIGFIFAESKRKVLPNDLALWLQEVPLPNNKKIVGVFVNPSIEEIDDVLKYVRLDILQLHGTEDLNFIKAVKEYFHLPIFKAIHHQPPNSFHLIKELSVVVDAFIIDSKVRGAWGGTGISFDWEAIPMYLNIANKYHKQCFVAGGITPENIQDCLTYSPTGIDLSSGIEKDGRKNLKLITQLQERIQNMNKIYPDEKGRYGDFGGKFVPETLMYALEELEQAYRGAINDPLFLEGYHKELTNYSGRPTALTFASRCTERFGGAKIYLKREDLNHTGAHKINNAIGQILLAKRMGKTKIVAETGAGQHGVAVATVCARLGLACKVFMGEEDIRRQELNVFRMRLLGAEVVPATSGSKTLKDATNEAIRYWVGAVEDTFYCIGSVVGPHPYPKIVRDFQSIIGKEARSQFSNFEGMLPDRIYACVGGGSNAMGMFYPFLEDEVELIGVEAAGLGLNTGQHAATITKGKIGVIHGSLTYLIQDETGQIIEPYSISAGLDYPGIGPEHAHLASIGRVRYESITDVEALEALQILCLEEGILPAIESAHALAQAFKEAASMGSDETILVCLSGRGDKDVNTLMNRFGGELDD